MKVGIITVHGTVNAGASLQTHALYHKLTMMGHSPMIINYRPERFSDMMDDRRKWHWKGVKTWLKALLMTADYWRGIAEKPKRKLPEKFIFYYPLQHNPDEIHFIARLKEETGLPCVSVESALRPVKGTDIQIPDSSPNEFLWLMDNAQYVITNSFHGLAFAILFKKRIISFKNEYRNCRLDSLCRLFGLEGLQVDSMADFSMENRRVFWQKMAYSDNILLREREKAELYLRQVLK